MLKGTKSMVEVIVGPEASSWYLHESLLSASSTFFRTAVHSAFREATEHKVTLPEDDPSAFELFVQFLYTEDFHCQVVAQLCDAYVMADKFGAHVFQAKALDKIYNVNRFDCRFSAAQVLWVFDNTLPGSALRDLAVDTVALAVLRKDLKFADEDWEVVGSVLPELMQAVVRTAKEQPARGSEEWVRKPRLAYFDSRIDHAGPFTLRPFSKGKTAEVSEGWGVVKEGETQQPSAFEGL